MSSTREPGQHCLPDGTPACPDPDGCEPCLASYNPLGLSPAHRTYCLAHKVSARVAAAWMTVGISAPENFCDLHLWGAVPDVALAWAGHAHPDLIAMIAITRHQDEFTGLYEKLSGDLSVDDGPFGIGYDPALINVVLSAGGGAGDVAAWQRLGQPLERTRVMIAGGISAAEAARPEIAGAGDAALAALAALNE